MRLSRPRGFVVCLLLLASVPSVWAQMQIINAVGVVVADGPQSTPVRGAEVSIVGIGSTITTQSGQFSIPINALMIGEKLTFQITMPGWHLVSPQSAETIMPRDPLQHPFRFTMVRDPTASSLTGNLGPGIYLSHLVGQLGSERGSTTASVWLSAGGPETYIVDSINIAHHPGAATSVGSGAAKPDAVYSFTFRAGSNETCLLNPALRLDKQDRREVWFSLGLAPSGPFSTSGGGVAVSLNYHVEGHPAVAGTLPLWSPPNDAVLLSKLLHRDIEILAERDARAISLQNRAFGFRNDASLGNAADSGCEEAGQPISSSRDGIRVSPPGLVKGDDESAGEAVVYSPLSIDRDFVNHYTASSESAGPAKPGLSPDQDRTRLNTAIVQAHLVATIVEQLRADETVMFDLCAGLPDQKCYVGLSQFIDDDRLGRTAREATMINVLVRPDSRFAEAVIHSLAGAGGCEKWAPDADTLSAVLVSHPTGKWLEALLELAACGDSSSSYALRALERFGHPLASTEDQRVKTVCEGLLNSEFPELEAADCLLKRGVSLAEINNMLDKIPSDIDDSRREKAMALRKSLKEKLNAKPNSCR